MSWTTRSGRGISSFVTTATKPVNKWLVAASISCGSAMGMIDATIVNTALPQIQGAVGATLQEVTWISTAYAIAAILLMPLVAFLGRRFGQKRVYLICLGIFLFGSVLCGLARTLPQLVAFRIIQGLGGGALQPTEEAILRQTFPKSEQGMAMALSGMILMLGPAFGPVLGGYIIDHLHWSWVFFISLPVGLVGLAMTSTFVHEDASILALNRARAAVERRNIDWAGIGLLFTCLATTELVLEEGQDRDWFDDPAIGALTFIALATLAAFVVRQLTARAPVMNLRLLKDRTFASSMLLSVGLMATLLANMFLLSVFLQQVRGFSAMQAGLANIPMMAGMLLAMPAVGAFYERISPRLTMGAGIALFSAGAWQVSTHVTMALGQWDLAFPLLTEGAGLAMIFVPLETTALSKIPRHLMADATGLSNVLKETGGAMGLALFTSVFVRHTAVSRAGVAAHVGMTNPLAAGRLAMSGDARGAALRQFSGIVTRDAAVLAYQHFFLLGGVMILALLPLLLLLGVDRGARSPDESDTIDLLETT